MRPQDVVIPIMRLDSRLDGVRIGSWVEDVDFRVFPIINLRRLGGMRNPQNPKIHSLPVLEITAYTDAKSISPDAGIIECEDLYETALDVLYDAHQNQTRTEKGSIHSIYEVMGATQFSSLYQDSWRIQGLIRLGIRVPRQH